MEKVNVLVVGAGAVGLACGLALAKKYDDVVVVDKEDSFGRHTSSRNSEVIHSGIYYPQNSLKHKLCVQGNIMLYDFCAAHNVAHKKTGKLVVAANTDELDSLQKLMHNGQQNQVPGLHLMEQQEVHKLEPKIKAIKALWVPTTGIMDSHGLMSEMETQIEDYDGFCVYDMEATEVKKLENGWQVAFSNNEVYQCRLLVNCSGLFSDKFAALAGKDIDTEDLHLKWCRGEYFKTTSVKGVTHLVYPLPDPRGISLGIHLVLDLNGGIRFGPNAVYTDELSYKLDETNKDGFYESINRYIDVAYDNLCPDDVGIRPKLQGPNQPVRDFYIADEASAGLPGFINLVGIDSPGLTSCLAIGNYVAQLADGILG